MPHSIIHDTVSFSIKIKSQHNEFIISLPVGRLSVTNELKGSHFDNYYI